ncbi:MAG TPA: two-component regulator propeller domain-containing protein [Paludibacter sp.]|nr:two-component regulator propeller domain-containing protein [Paludibacter sp.]
MKKIITLIVVIAFLYPAFVSAQLAMGKWRTHFAYNNVDQIAQSENKIYAVSEGSLYSIDKEDEGMEFYSKVSGLNDVSISKIEYDKQSQQLLIVYANGNIDLLSTGGVINVIDLFIKQMSTSKAINDIIFYDNKAYLSCSFGILVLNMLKREIADTYFIGANATEVNVIKTAIHNGNIYAATANSIYKASYAEPNLVNYEFWSTLGGLPGSGEIKSLGSFDGKLLLLRGGKLYRQNADNTWAAMLTDLTISYFNISGNNLFVYNSLNQMYLVNSQFEKVLIDGVTNVSDSEYDAESKTSWFAGSSIGVIAYNSGLNPAVKTYKPAGPAVNIPWSMTFAGQKLFVVQGGRWSSQYFRQGLVMMYENGVWSNINHATIKAKTNKEVWDFMNIAVDPTDNKHFYVTSYGTGLYEFKDNEFFKLHNYTNSTLEPHPLAATMPDLYTRLDGGVFDSEGNLFVANSAVSNNLKVLLKTGEWIQLKASSTGKETLGKIIINNQNVNHKWILSVRSGEILVLDDKGTFNNDFDDVFTVFKSFPDPDAEGALISPATIYTMAQDKNGVIWAGTEQGPLVFYNTANAFTSGFSCSRVKIPRLDGTNQADYLLKDERIKAIAVDGANRKWIGTESSGVYLMSENGQEMIHQFTVSNSPLLSNDIISIAINPVTGEVFFGTGQGIVSYQSDAAESTGSFSNVYAYPNPVREGYNGVITITGLVDNTHVKITDLNGNLICSTTSNGSIATWNGKDVHGRKVSTGIYLVICANEDGTQNTITKIMVIN